MSRIPDLLTLHNDDPADTFVMYSLAQEFTKAGDYDRAREFYTQLKKSDPEYVALYYHLGKLEEQLGNFSRAIFHYEEGIVIATRSGDHHTAGELRGALGMLRESMEEE